MKEFDNLIFRYAQLDDLDRIYSLEQICSQNPWSRGGISEELTKTASLFPIIETIHKLIIGFACSTLILNELHILEVVIDPQYRNKGLGEALIKHLLREAAAAGASIALLEVRVSNHSAIRVYEKCGFKRDAPRIGYYQDGEDALLMSKSLN
ncbi:MAG: ribosomal protein S18-alanine N-acetyltransferase [Chitinispirillales bacterium]|jgi:ribosomal-protein-alanine N-acetyltransferase|nr:ribosomal protein S18-alanine N-acetyltransferase [Chitinispirillales bacterium]